MKSKVYLQPSKNKMPHLGAILKEYLKKNQLNGSQLAKLLGRSTSTFDKFKKQSSFQTAILWEMSFATEHNFFADLASQLPTHFVQNPNAQTLMIMDMQEKIKTLEIEKNQLEKLLSR
jgi:plasmid maintenance system antidote protein VapI